MHVQHICQCDCIGIKKQGNCKEKTNTNVHTMDGIIMWFVKIQSAIITVRFITLICEKNRVKAK